MKDGARIWGYFKPKLNPEIRAKAERPGVRVFVSVPSASGLPVPERTLAQVYYFDDHIEIDAGGVEYDLSMDKIQSVSIQTNVDRQTQFVSSAGGALLGAAVAGPIGAAVGGRVKEKQTQQTESYLIIHYIGKDGTAAVLSFFATYTPKCRELAELFQKRPHQHTKIEL